MPLLRRRRLAETIDKALSCLAKFLYDRWAERKNIPVIEISITEIEKRRSVFFVCLHNVSGDRGDIAFRKRSRTSICILSLLDLGRKVWLRSSITVWRVVGPISRLIRIDFPLSAFLGNPCAPPFRLRLTSCLSFWNDHSEGAGRASSHYDLQKISIILKFIYLLASICHAIADVTRHDCFLIFFITISKIDS